MSSPPKQLALQVGALLRLAHDELLDELHAGVVARGFDDLRPHQLVVLRRVLLEDQRPTVIAAQLGLSKQAVNDLLRQFERLGYLTLVPDPEDGRAKRVQATERGWELAQTASRLSAGVGRRWARQVGPERYAVFEDVLREVVGMEEPRPGHAA